MTANPSANSANPSLSDDIAHRLTHFGDRLTEGRRDLLKSVVAQRMRHFTLVLEDLKDPHNISAVIRTSEVFGMQDVHVINEVNPYRVGPSVLKGSYKWLDIHCYARRRRCLEDLRTKGYRIAVASTAASQYLDEMDLTQPTAFYLGSEAMGNHPETLAAADLKFKIRQYGLTESMNVSVCGGVLMATLERWVKDRGRHHFTLGQAEQMALLADFYERSVMGISHNSPLHLIDD
jgi:tRNA (guanosine-2'-O-)-methyltransferase